MKISVLWGGATTSARGRCGVTRSNHYKFEKQEDEGRDMGVGSNDLLHAMDTHGSREARNQHSTPNTGYDCSRQLKRPVPAS